MVDPSFVPAPWAQLLLTEQVVLGAARSRRAARRVGLVAGVQRPLASRPRSSPNLLACGTGQGPSVANVASESGSLSGGSDATPILMGGGPCPPPDVATHGRQTADSAVAAALSPTAASGRLPPLQVPYALTGLARGVLPLSRPDLGRCQVRGVGPHFWALVAEAMGFTVVSMSWADPAFGRLMRAYGVGGKLLGGLRPRAPGCRGLACVFLDRESLDGLTLAYWLRWSCPHVFHCREDEVGSPPLG